MQPQQQQQQFDLMNRLPPVSSGDEDSLLSLAGEWAKNTGMHGLPNITRTNSKAKKVFWSLLLLAGLGMMVMQITMVVTKYTQHPILITRTSKISMPEPFPAVTVCNRNAAKKSEVKAFKEDEAANPENSTVNGTDKYSSMTGQIYDNKTSPMGKEGGLCPSIGMQYTMLDFYNRLTARWKARVGYRLDDILIQCLYNGRYCRKGRDFTRFLHPLYGNCYTFNGNLSNPRLNVEQPGSLNALSLILFAGQEEYVGTISHSAGFVVTVHEPGVQPFPEEYGLFVSPGFEFFIGLRKTKISRLPHPYVEDCEVNAEAVNIQKNMYASLDHFALPNVQYSMQSCIKTCTQSRVIQMCNCTSSNLPKMKPSVDFCYYDYNKTAGTISDASRCSLRLEMSSFAECHEQCKQECHEVVYDKTVSMSKWPSQAYAQDADVMISSSKNLAGESYRKAKTDAEKANFITENFVKVNIYFNDANLYQVTSSAAYEIMDFVSDLGGQVGLWLGLSMLTVFEVVEMLVDFGVLMVAKTASKAGEKKRKKGVFPTGPTTVEDFNEKSAMAAITKVSM